MNRPLKIVHTSDVHLHDGEDGLPIREAFAQVVDTVLETGAGLFLIAGDLFDHTRVEGDVIDFVYGELSRVSCPTVIIAGNHDCWEERSVLQRMDFRQAGHHVTLLDQPEGASVELPELQATIWGRCMLEHEPGNKPLAGAPGRTRDLWHIGMAHGLYMDAEESERSSLITPREIESSGFDYLALGHVHAHRQVRHGRTLACYPGAPAAQLGTTGAGSVAIVELVPGKGARATEHVLGAIAARRRSGTARGR
jgi:exonuclease SbcD